MKRNARASRSGYHQSPNLQIARLIMHHQERATEILRSEDGTIDSESRLAQCINQ